MAATTVLARANRTGIIAGPTIAIGANATGRYQVMADINTTDLNNPAKTFGLSLMVDRGDGQGFVFSAGMTFQGGPNQGKGGTATTQPGFIADATEYAGHTVQPVADFGAGGIRAGITVELI